MLYPSFWEAFTTTVLYITITTWPPPQPTCAQHYIPILHTRNVEIEKQHMKPSAWNHLCPDSATPFRSDRPVLQPIPAFHISLTKATTLKTRLRKMGLELPLPHKLTVRTTRCQQWLARGKFPPTLKIATLLVVASLNIMGAMELNSGAAV